MKSDNLGDDMQVEANSNGLIIETQKLREYFGIEYADNLGNILKQFTERLGNAIPKTISAGISDIERTAMVHSLSKSDSEDPNKIYCNKVKRNPNGGQRSEFNADKTKLLRASLFEYFRNDSSISLKLSILLDNFFSKIFERFLNVKLWWHSFGFSIVNP